MSNLEYAKRSLEHLEFDVQIISPKELNFEYKGNTIKFFPKKGWATGKGIKDGRGLNNLIRQLDLP